ncbi:hypothetical protein U8D42_18305 [Mycobacterium europaeum]|uniref:hypothetical protein n=1 Tax=Mycobacterium europaeum TaxID=761804 RepID=UPI002AE06EA3|nr:hypothetical protein [Mycobacterium europaeum]MEA1158695.1 hypothetical protein [Mycobacterium europaeum]
MDDYWADVTGGLSRCVDVSALDVANRIVTESEFAVNALDPYQAALTSWDIFKPYVFFEVAAQVNSQVSLLRAADPFFTEVSGPARLSCRSGR